MTVTKVVSKKLKIGKPPAIVMVNPKFGHNVGAVMRNASCFGIDQVFFTGDRVNIDPTKGERLPREERMKAYGSVKVFHFDYPLDLFDHGTPVCVEISPSAEQLPDFEHPEDPIYVFGPEDGSVPPQVSRLCHRFVMIPTRHCMNLSVATGAVLYDAYAKRLAAGVEPRVSTAELLDESRGWEEPEVYDRYGLATNR